MYIGWSEVNITPEKRVSLNGQFAERISEYVEKPLTATAFAVETESDQMVMVSCDLVLVSFSLVADIRAKVSEMISDLDVDKIIISAIHTHTGPGYTGMGMRQQLYGAYDSRSLLERYLRDDQKYVEKETTDRSDVASFQEVHDLLVDRISRVIAEAWQNRRPGSFSNAFGRAAVGMCRRVTYSDGSAQMWGDTDTAVFEAVEGGSDSGIELLYVFAENGQLTGIVANLACPAQCVQHRLFVSPDFWGEAKMLLRKKLGKSLFLLPLCSAAGDQCPVDLVRWVEPESDVHDPNMKRTNPPKRKADPSMFDLSGMRLVGKRIANEIISVFEEGLDAPQQDVPFVHHVHMMQLPLRRATISEFQTAERAIREYFYQKTGDVDYNDSAKLQVYTGLINRYYLQEQMDILDTEVHIIRLGSVAIATNPFELFLDYGNQIKARSKAEQTFIVQLANGSEGYLPTEKAEKGGHYSAFISSGQVGHAGGEQLVRETLKNINSLF